MHRMLLTAAYLATTVACSKDPTSNLTTKTAEPSATSEITRKVIERTAIAGTDEELRLMLMEFPPGASSPAHRHPVVGLCYVIEGTAESQYEGEDIKTLHAGESYQDSATKKHLVFRNPSTTSPLRFTCAARIGKDQQFLQPL
jgi:quercetin dioxygenase-like cupin family protein